MERLEKLHDRIEAIEIKQRKAESLNQPPIMPGTLAKGTKTRKRNNSKTE
jgi:hypothetical protein